MRDQQQRADLAAGAERVFAAAQGLEDASAAAFFIDGLLVIAVALFYIVPFAVIVLAVVAIVFAAIALGYVPGL